jgi:hypothetical protein
MRQDHMPILQLYLNIALGKASIIFPSVSIRSSLGISTCQYYRAFFRDCYRMLKMCRCQPVPGYRGPAVPAHAAFPGSRIHHRLDSQDHSILQKRAQVRRTEIRDFRFFMQGLSYTVAHEIPHHRKPVAFNVTLDTMRNIPQVNSPLGPA